MTEGAAARADAADDVQQHWRRNLAVVTGGSVTTIIAMTLLIPFLPVYVRELGVTDDAAVLRWSGIAYGATFLTAALTAPIWGALGDRYGRKSMLIRASLGMAVAMSLIGLADNVWQLVGLRLLVGLLGGYASGSTILVAAQTPTARSASALGILSAGIMAGNVAGPLLGGLLPGAIGARTTFFLTGALIFVAFLATTFLVKERRQPRTRTPSLAPLQGRARPTGTSAQAPSAQAPSAQAPMTRVPAYRLGRPVLFLLLTSMLLMFATMSIEPLVTVYAGQLGADELGGAARWGGIVMALGAAGSIVSAPLVGRVSDRVGHARVITICLLAAAALLLAQAFAGTVIVLCVLRCAMGLALGGLMPAVTASIRQLVPSARVGRVLGLGVSAQYVGQVAGPALGGILAGVTGIRSVFVVTALVLLGAAALSGYARRGAAGQDAVIP